MRVVIEVKRDDNAERVLNNLYKHTAMQSAFNLNMLALVDSSPKTLSLKDVLQHYIDYRKQVIKRRTEFDLGRAKERAHVLEGFKIALDHIDEIVKTIRASKTPDTALANLREKFELSEVQAKAILEMQLRRLTGLERQKVEDEYRETIKLISELESILGNPRKIVFLIRQDMDELATKYGDDRRTKILDDLNRELTDQDLVADEDVVITLSDRNYVKRMPLSTYKAQHRGGRGVIGMSTRDEDDVEHLVVARNHDRLYVFTDRGRVFALKAFELPDASRTAKGTPIQNILEAMQTGEPSSRSATGPRRPTSSWPRGRASSRRRRSRTTGTCAGPVSSRSRCGRTIGSRGSRRPATRTASSWRPRRARPSRSRPPTRGRWAVRPRASPASGSRRVTRSSGWAS